MIKKLLIVAFTLVLVLCSCATMHYTKTSSPIFAYFGEPGEIVLTGRAEFFLPNVPCLDNITIVYKNDDIYGSLEGMYTKPVLNQVVKHSDIQINGISDFDYCYYNFGKTFFTTSGIASEFFNSRVRNSSVILSADEISKMQSAAEYAIYANSPDIGYKNVEKFILAKNENTFNAMIESSNEKTASSLFKMLKSDFNTFETKAGLSSSETLSLIDNHFVLDGKSVYIIDLASDDYLEYWVRRLFNNGN